MCCISAATSLLVSCRFPGMGTWCLAIIKETRINLVNPLIKIKVVQLSLQNDKCLFLKFNNNKNITFSAEKRWLAILLCSLKKRFWKLSAGYPRIKCNLSTWMEVRLA